MSQLSSTATPKLVTPELIVPPELARHREQVKRFSSTTSAKKAMLVDMQAEIEDLAVREYGLELTEQRYEVVTHEQLNQVIAREGFPIRYPHWQWGRNYDSHDKRREYGLGRVYELIINNDPCYGYLVDANSMLEQRFVLAHCIGHNHFFRHNLSFAHTDRRMIDSMANHASRVRKYIDRYGEDTVEKFIDNCISLSNLIDPHIFDVKRRPEGPAPLLSRSDEIELPPIAARFQVPRYMDSFVNPKEQLQKEDARLKEEWEAREKYTPPEPERDVLLFLIENAPLKDWQADILQIIRSEAYYFDPQRRTKIMNEGWACYWHRELMTQHLIPKYPSELTDFIELDGAVLSKRAGPLNPYRLGVELFHNIEKRWDEGRFGEEYEKCDDREKRRTWDKQLGLGRKKIMEIMRTHNDVTFLDEFLTEEFAVEYGLFAYQKVNADGNYEGTSKNFSAIKTRLLSQLQNAGMPQLSVVDANHRNAGELVLQQKNDGQALDIKKAYATMESLFEIWTRPIHVLTYDQEGKFIVVSFDGKERKPEIVSSGGHFKRHFKEL